MRLEYSDEAIDTTYLPEPPIPRHSEHERKQTEFHGQRCNVTDIKEPKSDSEAQANLKWLEAMENKIGSLHDNNAWELVKLPEDRKAVGSKWVFKVKTTADGSTIERCKAHLVAQGYSQQEGLDYDETFSPVIRSESVHSVIALATVNDSPQFSWSKCETKF